MKINAVCITLITFFAISCSEKSDNDPKLHDIDSQNTDESLIESDIDETPDATQPSCETLECDEHATCEIIEDKAVCVCVDGYIGDGINCSDESLWKKHTVGTMWQGTYVYADDIDEDGYLDIITSNTNHMGTLQSDIFIFKNSGDPQDDNWDKLVVWSSEHEDFVDNATGIVTGDLDRDGKKDVIVAASGPFTDEKGALYWFKADDNTYTTWKKFTIAHETGDKYYKVYIQDFNNDGWDDIVVGGDKEANIFINPSNPADGEKTWERVKLPEGTGICINVADMNNDGRLDIISANRQAKKVSWVDVRYENDSFTFKEHIVDDNLDGAFDVMAMNINGDEYLDVVVSKIFVKGVHWYEAPQATTNQWIKHDVDPSFAAADVYVGDIDNDNQDDFLVAGFGMGADTPDSLSWFEYYTENNEIKWKTHHAEYINLKYPGDVSLDDIDNDGDLDIVTLSCTEDGDVVWYENLIN